jgi:dolichyl-phosphate beta-glucosyltransferase
VYDTQCGAKIFRANAVTAALFARPFRSRWIFDVEVLARYLAEPVPPGELPRRERIYEVAVPAWHHVSGSKLRVADYLRAILERAAIRHDSR